MILCILGGALNVIPKYFKRDLAKRHLVAPKVRGIMLIHILSGVATVHGMGLVGILGGFSGMQFTEGLRMNLNLTVYMCKDIPCPGFLQDSGPLSYPGQPPSSRE